MLVQRLQRKVSDMTVHNHGIDPSCKERLVGECLLKPGAIVLDLDGYAANELASWLDGTDAHMSIGDRLRVAREIRHQTKPPRIPEPGLWGVVREGVDGDTYVRESFGTVRQWSRLGGHGLLATWDEIKNPTLIREGVSA